MDSVEDIEKLTGLIRVRTGLGVSDTKTDDIAQAIEKLVSSRRLASVSALMNMLSRAKTSESVWQELIEIITVGETYFYRNEAQFEALRTEIFAPLIAKRRESGNKYLRVWCAGCATGEEAYSLAMLLCELLPDYQNWQITLIATDINTASLEHAKRGIYRSWSFRNETPDDIKHRWFTPVGETFKLNDVIKHMVTFGSLNLVSDVYPSFESGIAHFDVIVCRNVTIYFDQETTRAVIGKFYETLNNNGWLVVGHAEPNSSIYSDFTPRNFPNTVVYQKTQSEFVPVQSTPNFEPIPPEPVFPKPAPRIVPIEPAPEPALAKPTWEDAKAAADLEDWQEALILLAKAESENRFQPQVYYLRAIVQLHLDDLSGAHASLRQSLYCDPKFVLAHYTLGELYEMQGDIKNAKRSWKMALTGIEGLDPQSHLPFGEDLTVEMLQGLLIHGLQRITHEGTN